MVTPSQSERHSLSIPVQVRLSPEIHEYYADQAAKNNIGLSTELRHRLQDLEYQTRAFQMVVNSICEIETRLEEMSLSPPREEQRNEPSSPDPVAFETLMLLRILLKGTGRDGDIKMLHAEMRRQGVTPWEMPMPRHSLRK